MNGLYKEVWFTKVSYCSLPMASALVILFIAFSNNITFVSSAKRLSLVSEKKMISQPQPSHQCPKAFSRAISIWSPPLITQYLLSPETSSQDHGDCFAIAKRGWSTVNTGTFPRFTYPVALAMTSMPCFTNASECHYHETIAWTQILLVAFGRHLVMLQNALTKKYYHVLPILVSSTTHWLPLRMIAAARHSLL